MLKIILDFDDVLGECNEFSLKFLNREYGTEYKLGDIVKYGLHGNLLDERLKYFNDPEFIRNIPLMDGAVEFVNKLCDLGEVVIATSVQMQCAGARFEAIVSNFPMIKPGNILVGARKDMLIGEIMLDDNLDNLEGAAVKYPVLFQKPWNASNSGILSVNNYESFIELVKLVRDKDQAKQMEPKKTVALIGPMGSGKREAAEKLVESGYFECVKTYSTKNDPAYKYLTAAEFFQRRDAGFFFETSSYLSEMYGVNSTDINNVLKNGKIPLLRLDINGAVKLKEKYNALMVYVDAPKERCIRAIISRDISDDEKIKALMSLDGEIRSHEFCDLCISADDPEFTEKVLKYCVKEDYYADRR